MVIGMENMSHTHTHTYIHMHTNTMCELFKHSVDLSL